MPAMPGTCGKQGVIRRVWEGQRGDIATLTVSRFYVSATLRPSSAPFSTLRHKPVCF